MRLRGVRHRYRGTGTVLDGVDLRADPGRPVVVTGANGSGKSTLLRIAAGVLAPAAGVVTDRPPVAAFLPTPFPGGPLTARRLLRHLDAVHGLRRGSAHAVLDDLGFGGDPDAPVAALSAGQRTTVGLAQALAVRDGLVVLDEPWTALDERAAAALAAMLAGPATRVLVVADHSGRAAGLPGATVHRLERGRLRTTPAGSVPAAARVRIAVSCGRGAATVAAALPAAAVGRCDGTDLVVTVDGVDADRWLASALAAGCSVVDVTRLPARSA